MKKFLSVALLSALVFGASSVVYANVCAFDPVPAATLLFPYVVYDYNGGTQGDTTIFAITNVSSEAQIVHVTLWTDFSVAILDFNIVLSGYDVQQINIRDILAAGHLPVTGTYTGPGAVSGVDYEDGPVPPADGPVSPGNTASPGWGNHLNTAPPSLPDAQSTGVFNTTTPRDRCTPANPSYPGLYEDGIPASILALFQSWLQSSQTADRFHLACTTGDLYFLGDTFDSRTTADPTAMYVTADVVYSCNKLFPDEAGYFTPGPDGEGQFQNVLIGDLAWVNSLNRYSEMDNAVHLEADRQLGYVATDDGIGEPISFYHRYTTAQSRPGDYREPLPTAWAFRYVGAEPGDGLTTYIRYFKAPVWGDVALFAPDLPLDDGFPMDFWFGDDFYAQNESPTFMVAFDCLAYTYYSWDEEEDVLTTTDNPWSQPGLGLIKPNLMPLETMELPIEEFNTVDDFGWMLFVWPESNLFNFARQSLWDYYQTWMGVKYVFNDYSAFHSGAVMANFNCFSDQVLPNLGINYDYVDIFGYTNSPDPAWVLAK